MENAAKIAYEQWRELIKQILSTYEAASEARRSEADSNKWLALNNICIKCAKMLAIVEGIERK